MTLFEFLVPLVVLVLGGAALLWTRAESRRLDARLKSKGNPAE